MKRVLMIGATSAIAQATARELAKHGAELALLGRNTNKLESVARDLVVRGAGRVEIIKVSDLSLVEEHGKILEQVEELLPGYDTVVIAYGILGDQQEAERSYDSALEQIQTNFLSVVSFLTHISNLFAERGSGTIVVVSSVAGDCGRKSNYIYGSAKGGLSIFLQGLRNRLHSKGVKVLTVKPGFVDSPMTSAITKNFLFVTPDRIGSGIVRALDRHGDVVYLPWFWRWIMLVIKLIPETIFKRLSL